MSDGLDMGQHGTAVTGGGVAIATLLTTWASKFFRARDEKEREEASKDRETQLLVKLAKVESDLAHALRMLEAQSKLAERVAVLEYQFSEARGFGERLALVEGKAVAAHSRGDDVNRRLERLEARP